jgi:hypothetical protein
LPPNYRRAHYQQRPFPTTATISHSAFATSSKRNCLLEIVVKFYSLKVPPAMTRSLWFPLVDRQDPYVSSLVFTFKYCTQSPCHTSAVYHPPGSQIVESYRRDRSVCYDWFLRSESLVTYSSLRSSPLVQPHSAATTGNSANDAWRIEC